MKKRLIIEDEAKELDDFQKLLLLNKKRISPDDVEFVDEDGKEYDEIKIDSKGMYFDFDGLEEFLKFFFPDTYGEEAYEAYEASYLDQMYNERWDFGFSDKAYDEWREGYILGDLCSENITVLYNIIKLVSPNILPCFVKNESGGYQVKNESCEVKIRDVLDSLPNISDNIQWIWSDAKQDATEGAASDYIKNVYCDGLKQFGVENFSHRLDNCFRSYFISWGNLAMMFINNGEFDGNLIQTMRDYIERNFKNHTPDYYEIEYNAMDYDKFKDVFCNRVNSKLEELEETIIEDYNPEYLKILNQIIKMGGLGNYIPMKAFNGEYEIRFNSIDEDTLKVSFLVRKKGAWGVEAKQGKAPIKDVINFMTFPGLFKPDEYRG
jgi:hypothetical protein